MQFFQDSQADLYPPERGIYIRRSDCLEHSQPNCPTNLFIYGCELWNIQAVKIRNPQKELEHNRKIMNIQFVVKPSYTFIIQSAPFLFRDFFLAVGDKLLKVIYIRAYEKDWSETLPDQMPNNIPLAIQRTYPPR